MGKPTGVGGGGQIDHPNVNAFVVGATNPSKPVVRRPKTAAKKAAAKKAAAAAKKAAAVEPVKASEKD